MVIHFHLLDVNHTNTAKYITAVDDSQVKDSVEVSQCVNPAHMDLYYGVRSASLTF